MYNFLSKSVVYIFPALTLALLGLLFIRYRNAVSRGTPASRSARGFKLPFHKCSRRDAVIALAITVVYGAVAFYNIGDTVAPQTFHRFTGVNRSVTINLGGEYEITKIVYYTGGFHQKDKDVPCYTISVSVDGGEKREAGKMEQTHGGLFHWKSVVPSYVTEETESEAETTEPEPVIASQLTISTSDFPIELGELALYGADGQMIDASGFDVPPDKNFLFDEQDTVPEEFTQMNSMYFDEIYHARTAREFLNSDKPYENTHPPLGKVIISIGITLFGMTPFGWRAPGVLFGILMLPFFYAFVKNMFGKTWLAACMTLVFAFDFMHFVQTRIATIDTYGVFFTILMFFFMYRFLAAGYTAKKRKQLVPLALAGISFGLGAASKWTCFYAGGGLLVLLIVSVVSEMSRLRYAKPQKYDSTDTEYNGDLYDAQAHIAAIAQHRAEVRAFIFRLLAVIATCAVFFLAVSGAIYYFSYYFFARGMGQELSFDIVWANQVSMYNYHSKLVATHPFQSSWYQWIVDGRPILYYSSSTDGARTAFSSYVSPTVCWGGLAAIIALFAARYRGASRRLVRSARVMCGVAAVCTLFLILIDQSTAYEEPIAALSGFAELPSGVMTAFVAVFMLCVFGLFLAPRFARLRNSINPTATFIIIGFLAQLLPWISVSRCTFSYHYFPSVPFLILALAWVFNRYDDATILQGAALPRAVKGRVTMWTHASQGKKAAILFTVGTLLLFVMFYPVLQGVEMPIWYSKFITRWLPSFPI